MTRSSTPSRWASAGPMKLSFRSSVLNRSSLRHRATVWSSVASATRSMILAAVPAKSCSRNATWPLWRSSTARTCSALSGTAPADATSGASASATPSASMAACTAGVAIARPCASDSPHSCSSATLASCSSTRTPRSTPHSTASTCSEGCALISPRISAMSLQQSHSLSERWHGAVTARGGTGSASPCYTQIARCQRLHGGVHHRRHTRARPEHARTRVSPQHGNVVYNDQCPLHDIGVPRPDAHAQPRDEARRGDEHSLEGHIVKRQVTHDTQHHLLRHRLGLGQNLCVGVPRTLA
eukprot:m.1378699 g.1378699  ORF g.1378699 m.1378699 type:complete len:297 (-) comp24964_c2_seq48:1412-2302(-)